MRHKTMKIDGHGTLYNIIIDTGLTNLKTIHKISVYLNDKNQLVIYTLDYGKIKIPTVEVK